MTDRVKSGGYSALIEAAYAAIPGGMHHLIRPHWFCGSDPVLAGLHAQAGGDALDTRSYRDTAHVAYDFHQLGPRDRRHVTVIVPSLMQLRSAVHELGHVLDESLGFAHIAQPVTEYARVDRYEAFAEAFTAWVLPFGHGYGAAKDRLYDWDRATVALFDGVSA